MAGVPKLIVLSEQMRGKTFELSKDLYTAGRVEERDICIKDPTISSYHCDLVKTDSTFTIRDHGSTNGSRVNNVPIKEQELQNSDILQLGGIELLFDCDDKSVTTVMRTQTGIDLSGADLGVTTVKNMNTLSPFEEKRGGGEKSSMILKAFVALLIIVILGLIAFIVKNIVLAG